MRNPIKTKPVILASTVMSFLAIYGLWLAQGEFTVDSQIEPRLQKLSQQLTEENLKNQMLAARFEDFRQEVAVNLPAKQPKMATSLRDLASVIPHWKSDKNTVAQSQRLLKEGKALFEAKNYDEATKKLLEIISRYPESASQLEASYHLVNAYFLTGNKQSALDGAEKMLNQFPESPWTAKALLIMADIYKEQNRRNDMLDVYQTILESFNDEDIKNDVKARISSLGK